VSVDTMAQGRGFSGWLPVALALCGSVLGLLLAFIHSIGRGLMGEAAGPTGPEFDRAEIGWLVCALLGIVCALMVRRWPRAAAALLAAAALGGWLAPVVTGAYAVPFWLAVWSLAAVPMLAAAVLAWRSARVR
jgi:hypothetical protein